MFLVIYQRCKSTLFGLSLYFFLTRILAFELLSYRLFWQGGLLFSGGEDRNITAWDTKAGKVAYHIEDAHSFRVKGIVVLSRSMDPIETDEPYLVASASSDGVIRVWDVRMAVKEKPYPLAEANTKSRLTCLAGTSLKCEWFLLLNFPNLDSPSACYEVLTLFWWLNIFCCVCLLQFLIMCRCYMGLLHSYITVCLLPSVYFYFILEGCVLVVRMHIMLLPLKCIVHINSSSQSSSPCAHLWGKNA